MLSDRFGYSSGEVKFSLSTLCVAEAHEGPSLHHIPAFSSALHAQCPRSGRRRFRDSGFLSLCRVEPPPASRPRSNARSQLYEHCFGDRHAVLRPAPPDRLPRLIRLGHGVARLSHCAPVRCQSAQACKLVTALQCGYCRCNLSAETPSLLPAIYKVAVEFDCYVCPLNSTPGSMDLYWEIFTEYLNRNIAHTYTCAPPGTLPYPSYW